MSSSTALSSDDPPQQQTLIHLPSHAPSFRCSSCTTELGLQDELVSRNFSGGRGAAYLVRTTINTKVGEKVLKQLITGRHTIATLYCKGCSIELGWTYFTAPEQSQKYKEGKYILEKVSYLKDNKWSLDQLDPGRTGPELTP
ncbi:yippee-domain-containing protein [Meredithblackwellia eburnea MCA 4105]